MFIKLAQQLISLNDAHIASAALYKCGGLRIFGALPQRTHSLDTDALLPENPEAIIVSAGENETNTTEGKRFSELPAGSRVNLFSLNVDWMTRDRSCIPDGTEHLCKQLDIARRRRGKPKE